MSDGVKHTLKFVRVTVMFGETLYYGRITGMDKEVGSHKDLYHVKYDGGDENDLHLRECSNAVDLMNKLREQEKQWLSSGSESDYQPNDE